MFLRAACFSVLGLTLASCGNEGGQTVTNPCEQQSEIAKGLETLRPTEADSIAAQALQNVRPASEAECWASLLAIRTYCAALRGDSIASDSLLAALLAHHEKRNDPAGMCVAYCKAGEGWYKRTHATRATHLLDSAVAAGRRSGDGTMLANALSSRAGLALDIESPGAAIALHKAALTALGSAPADTSVLIRVLSNLGYAYGWDGALDSAMRFHLRAIDVLRLAPNEQKLAWNRMNLAVVLTDQGNYLAAIGLFEDALRYYERERAAFEIGACLHYLAYCQQHVLTADRVVGSYQRAIAIYDSLGPEPRSMIVRMALARYLIDLDSTGCAQAGMTTQERDEIAAGHCRRALFVGRKYPIPGQMADVLDALCDVERSLGQNDSALVHAREAIALRERIGDKGRLAGSYKDLGAVHRALGRTAEAERAYRTGLDLIAQASHPENAASLHNEVQSFYAEQGRFREAHAHLLESRRLSNNLMDEEKRQEVVAQQLRFDFDRAQLADSLRHAERLHIVEEQRELAELRAEKAQRSTWAAVSGILLLLGGGISFYCLDRRRRRERFAKLAAQLEAKALRAQMDPHFIGNTLHAVNSYLLSNEPAAASSMLSRFAKWIRSTLESSRQEEVSLKDDLEAIRTYLALEQARTRDRFTMQFAVPKDEELLRARIPPMLIQPFVENAIQHGLLPKDGQGSIVITVTDRTDHVLIIVEDNGVGRGASVGRIGERRSVSTAITRDRLHLLGERSGKPAAVRVIDLPQGTRVELEVPLG